MATLTCGFIGLGLIGGSIAKALKHADSSIKVIAYDINRESVLLAKEEGIADVMADCIDKTFSACDYLFLCAPVSHNDKNLSVIRQILSPDCILTDVGSVKGTTLKAVEAAGLSDRFIGGHPMAGSEKNGFVNAKPHLIENAYYILTPSAKVSEAQVQSYRAFVESLKALPIILDYRQHDYVTGAISHLPHILAASLVNFVKEHDTREELMKMLAAGGFKDITRIASSSPVMWQQVCLKNWENISQILGEFIQTLTDAKQAVDQGSEQTLYSIFESSRDYRNSMPEGSSGPIKKQFAVYCDIIDEAGGIATIATILASNMVNIKNIGIIHNREFEEGVLRIEFYDENASAKATELLKKHRYIVYEV